MSWRVQILPFLEENGLYKQFRLDEPWDSEHNAKLIPRMPKVFQNPSEPLQPGKASYLAVVGKGFMFEGDKGRRLAEVTDGTAHTIMVVEADANRAVTWTRPDDWEFDAKRPLAGLGHAHPNGFNALFADGSVRFISASIDPKTFHALLTINGGEPINAGQY
ncbi:MAG: DUF1559 domain-containing protein [Thermoguttaceae bacterium]